MAELASLIAKRGHIKARLTRVATAVREFKQGDNVFQLKTRLPYLESVHKEFNEVQVQISFINPDSVDMNGQETFEKSYFDIVSEIESILDKRSASNANNAAPSISGNNSTNNRSDSLDKKLPPINLPHFSGVFTEWSSFYDTFKSLIQRNDSLDDCERFHYLKLCLTDEASRAVERLPISEANYAEAWKILKKRYENKRLICQEHVLALIKAPIITKASHTSIAQLLDNISTNLAALRTFDLPVDSWDGLLVPIITEKLDYATKSQWQTSLNSEIPKLTELIICLEKRLENLRSVDPPAVKPFRDNYKVNKPHYQEQKVRHVAYAATKKPQCVQCRKASHNIYQCLEFLRLSIPERIKQVQKFNLCDICLRDNHASPECRSTRTCQECKQKHNSLLHSFSETQVNTEVAIQTHSIQSNASVSNHCAMQLNNVVLLSTALLYIKDSKGSLQECRALLDAGSQSCFISKLMIKNLKLQTKSVNIPIVGISKKMSTITECATVTIKSRYNGFQANLQCLVMNKITDNLPSKSFPKSAIEIPKNLSLADPNFNEAGEIDLLLGAEIFWNLLCVGQIQMAINQPVFQKTHLGWVIGGTIKLPSVGDSQAASCNLVINKINPLEDTIGKFWELEQYPTQKCLSVEEGRCETHFTQTCERTDSGRFVVKLPFKSEPINMGSSYESALKRFYGLERKFSKNLLLKKQYSDFITEYRDLNHMELVAEHQINSPSCYLPHHAILKECSTTTKLRVVFDASAKSSNGLSLNDNLMCGPVIQQDLFSILTRFRTFQYVLNGDITKMYRQIRIHSSQVDYQRILWRENITEPIQIFRLNTLTYGTKPASFIATRCLQELAYQYRQEFPVSSEIIGRDFYMDDLLTGANCIREVINLRNEITNILNRGGFELRKFSSNNPQILPDTSVKEIVNLDKNGDTKTLGLFWNCTNDFLKYEVKINTVAKKVTKRSILSAVAQIFDPLGLIGPVTMRAKIIMQQLWSLKLGWDESVPMTIHTMWLKLLNQLTYLNDLKIERKVVLLFPVISIEMHGFCDASQQGYGAAIYIRCTDSQKRCTLQLLCAKSRVAPLKTVTIPRLELCSALLLAKLAHSVRQTLNLNINTYYWWTDSTIVLAWLASCPSTLNTFVANRVTEIQTVTTVNDWYHIRSESNPADIISRGLLPQELLESDLWFHGPNWLRDGNYDVHKNKINFDNVDIIEKRKVVLLSNRVSNDELPLFAKYSKFSKLQHVTAICLRFIHNCKNKTNKLSGKYSLRELQTATQAIIRNIQQREFPNEVHKLKKGERLDKQSKLVNLNPFIDESGLLRVGGRLRNASVGMDKKYPIILPKQHHVTKLIIIQEHERQLHAGAQATLASLRQNYWVINARSVIRFILHKCIRCFRVSPQSVVQKMGDLPKDRVQLTRPFFNTGIDYAGPILIKEGRGRGKRSIKAYIALFICFSTKAVHVELVGDLSTEAFLNALKRFIARRGCVSCLYSDNATNFVGAKRELEELAQLFKDSKFQKNLNSSLESMNITWKFIPPRSPNMGGLWEINIKSVKYHLKRILGNALLTYEEMYSLLTQIESCLNSRPLTPLTSDPNDLVALTPGHFLIGEPLTALAEPDITEIKLNRLSRWQHVEQVRQHFWKRWHREYLLQLQKRTKWQQGTQQQLQIGDMVILVEDGTPPQQWLLGRVVETHPGADKIVRVVTVQTVRGLFKRAVKRLCLLPISD